MGVPTDAPTEEPARRRPIAAIALAVTAAAVALQAGTTLVETASLPLADLVADAAVLAAAATMYLDSRRTRRRALELTLHAERDSATGLANRAGIQRALLLEVRRGVRERRPLGLIAMEIDPFAQLGDAARLSAARRVAGLMTETARRAGDVGAYLDDGVFMLLLPNTDAAGTTLLAEHLCGMVQVLALPLPNGRGGVVSLSIGTTSALPTGATRPEDYWRAANLALAEARRHGGNCVISVAPAAPPAPVAAPRVPSTA